MDNKRLVTVILISLVIMGLWYATNMLLMRLYPQAYQPQHTASQTSTTAPAGVATTNPATQPTTQSAVPPSATGPSVAVRPHGQPGPANLGHNQFDPKGTSNFPMGIALTPRGAAVEAVTLNRFRQVVGKDNPYVYQHPYTQGPPELSHALASQAIIINGATIDLSSAQWGLVSQPTQDHASYAVDVMVPGASQPLTIIKTYQLLPKTTPSEGYQVIVRYDFKNQTGQPLKFKTLFNGPNVPPVENTRDVSEIVTGHNGGDYIKLEFQGAAGLSPDKPAVSLNKPKSGAILWSGVSGAYFEGIVQPQAVNNQPAPIADIQARAVEKRSEEGNDFTSFTWETTELSVPDGQQISLPLEVYFGPRARAVLDQPYYANYPRGYNKTLVMTSGPCGYCTFDWLVNILVWILNVLHMGLRDWGLAIIGLVLLVRLALHPISKKSQISMSKMSKMGPEVERLKKKYGDNKDELNRAMMQLYKEQGATPILGCLPMLLQMPIWIALWNALQSTFELRQASFLWGFTWIKDLAQPDRLIYFPNHAINILGWVHIDALNLLPVLLAGVWYIQQKMTPQPVATTPEQEQQQKMMRWMSVIFPLLFYSGPAGLNLYILTSTAIGIWESKRIRDHLKEQEEAEKAGKVIVDAKPTKASRRLGRGEKAPTEPQGCMGGWFANLQAKARQIQEQTEKKYGKGK